MLIFKSNVHYIGTYLAETLWARKCYPVSIVELTCVPLYVVAEDLGVGSLEERDAGVIVLEDVVVADGGVVARAVQQNADVVVAVHLVAVDDQVVASFRRNCIQHFKKMMFGDSMLA